MKLLSSLLAATLVLTPIAAQAAPAKAVHATAPSAGKALHALFQAEWDRWMTEDPGWASYVGDRRFDDRWKDFSPEAQARRVAATQAAKKRLAAIDRSRLTAADQLNYDLFKRELDNMLEDAGLHTEWMPLNHMGGIHTAHDILSTLSFETEKDYTNWIKRLRAFPRLMDQTMALLEEGRHHGLLPPKAILSRIPEQLSEQLPDDPAKSPFYKPFENFPAAMGEERRSQLRAEARTAIAESVLPAYRKFQTYFTQTYLPAAPDQVGLRNLPHGDRLYAYYARYYTTTTMSPHAIHERGLAEVARIRLAMSQVMTEVGFKGTLNEFFASLKQDKRFIKSDPQAMLTEYRALAKRVDPLLGKLFKKLPRAPYGVEPVPAELAPNSSAAYYIGPTADGSRGGTFYANLYNIEKRPTYEMTPLLLHEAVPGHHLQIALASEQGELPAFRRFGGYTAFIEGWGLYAESLGQEMGLYQDPYVRFGKLNMEMRRALRLVLDTGMHFEGWDRQRAIRFFLENAAKTEMEATNEVDRYLAWPGQALAYKTGELKLQELRARAQKALGAKFDLREFHEQALQQGALPLDILEQRIDAWIAQEKKR